MLKSKVVASRIRCCRNQVLTVPRCVSSQTHPLNGPYSQDSMKMPPTPGQVEPTTSSSSSSSGSSSGSSSSSSSGSSSSRPPPPPERPPKKKGIFGKLVGVTLVGATGLLGYAWLDHEFRSKLKAKVPYSEDVMDAVFVYLPDSPSVPAPIISGDKTKQNVPRLDQTLSPSDEQKLLPKLKEAVPPLPTVPVPEPPAPTPQPEPELSEKEKATRAKLEKEAGIAAENMALEVILSELSKECESSVSEAKSLQQAVIDATKKHTALMKTAVEDESDGEKKEAQWQSVADAYTERKQALDSVEKVLLTARENLEKLGLTIEDGRNNPETKKNKALYINKKKLDQLNKEMNNKQKELSKIESESKSMSWYRDLMTEARTQLKYEIEGLAVGKSGKYTEEDWRLLIGHAHRRIQQLQQQLAEQAAFRDLKLEAAVSDQRDKDELQAEKQVEQEREKLIDEYEQEKEKWIQRENDLLNQHARQMAAYSKQLNEEFEHELNIRVVQERQTIEGELHGLTGRHRGIEAALAARAENESTAKQAQDLWLATVALNGAIMVGNETGTTWEEQLKPLEKEVDTLFFAAKNNPFVSLVLETIPEKALIRGVYTEENLKQRFRKVSRVAQRVALIDETGGSLFKFMMSYVQSAFVFTSVYATEEGDTVNMADMDTFQLCGHAKYWLQKGNIEQALKFMNQLRGEPRRVAADWIEEARMLLETQQAAKALLAFASSTGLGTIF